MIEKNDAFHLEAETPGMTQKDVSIECHNDILPLKGDREQSSKSDKNDYCICKFRKQSFVQSFRINAQINSEKVVAKMGQGILKVTLPKKEQTKVKKKSRPRSNLKPLKSTNNLSACTVISLCMCRLVFYEGR